jgi:serine/tyrosine/threonine adenylyltransferase
MSHIPVSHIQVSHIQASPLPETFWRKASPLPVAAPRFLAQNQDLAEQLGLGKDFFATRQTLAALSGNDRFQNFEPVSLAYSGHQFGSWNPLMGDGRAHLIATLPTGFEIHLKGSGKTPYSRNGDGRAALGPMLREYIISEAFAGLGIPATRTLSVVATGEQVYRRRAEPGGIAARIAKSHVRVGTFQFAAVHLGPEGVRALYEHERARSHPHTNTPTEFLASVISKQATLIARWMCVGFIHGVMNTDNMAISGETIDFGPCAFIDQFHPQKVFSSIDQFGRYAWDQQPTIAHWNLTRFAESLLSLLHANRDEAVKIATAELQRFVPQFEDAFETGMLAKFGISERREGDDAFIAQMLTILMEEKLDFTLFFRELTRGVSISEKANTTLRERCPSPDHELMKKSNPIYIARNHQVEAALMEAEQGNMARFDQLCTLLKNPFTEQHMPLFEAAPTSDEEVQQTFCGT